MQFTIGKLLVFGLAIVLTPADAIAQTPNLTSQRQVERAAPMNFQGRYLVSISGSIDFWRIATDPLNPHPTLVQTRYSVPVTRGAHSMVLVP